jgi:hypothetical protein
MVVLCVNRISMATFFCASTSVLPAKIYWPARIASPAANVGLADDAEAEEQVEGYQRRLRDGGIHTQWPKIIAKLFIGRPTLVSWLRLRSDDRLPEMPRRSFTPSFFLPYDLSTARSETTKQ